MSDERTHDTPRVFYTNVARVAASGHDFVIAFGLRNPLDESGSNQAPVECTVFMSPAHFKVLAGLMTKILDEYQQALGEIPVPPQSGREGEADELPDL